MRAIDVWVVLCYIGIFSAVMEYCLIIYLTRNSALTNKSHYEKNTEAQEHATAQAEEILELGGNGGLKKKPSKRQKFANTVENITRFILPFYNILFPITYFAVCVLYNIPSGAAEAGENWVGKTK